MTLKQFIITNLKANQDDRYGYNTQERVDEVSGKGNHYTAEFWQYSPRLERRWEIDPVVKPWESPYVSMGNNPISFNDPLGDEFDPASQEVVDKHKEGTQSEINALEVDLMLLNYELGEKRRIVPFYFWNESSKADIIRR